MADPFSLFYSAPLPRLSSETTQQFILDHLDRTKKWDGLKQTWTVT
jgi:hypothetical protein